MKHLVLFFSVLLTLVGVIFMYGFVLEFLAILLHNIIVVELGPLYSLWDALWKTLLIVTSGFLLFLTGTAIVSTDYVKNR